MKINSKYLYDLLPAYYRILDAEQDNALEAFIEVLAREAGVVEANIDQLYENWFIETAEEWVVPYIGDLLGVRGIHEIEESSIYSRRAYVANTLSYRRRKGTAPILEQIALDITGWRARVVEFFQILASSQNLNHIRLHNLATPDLRQMNRLDLVNGPFDTLSHTVEVGRISAGLGKYNIPNIGLYLWRLQSYPLQRVDAFPVTGTGIPSGAFTFNGLGLDSALFNQPRTEQEITHLAEEIHVPGLLRRRGLFDELEARRDDQVNGRVHTPYFFSDDATSARRPASPAFRIYLNGSSSPIPFEEITICNLSDWNSPPATKIYEQAGSGGSVSSVALPITAAVDPALGRLVLTDASEVNEVLVDYSYGFSADLGGGPYDREKSLAALREAEISWQVGVSKEHTAVGGETIYQDLSDAIQEWNAGVPGRTGLICIMDSRTYAEDLTGLQGIVIAEGQQLYLIAADWPAVDLPGSTTGQQYRPQGTFNPEGVRPHIRGDLEVEGRTTSGATLGGDLTINGLLIEGKLDVLEGDLNRCALVHTTLVPERGGLSVADQEGVINLSLDRSICGPVNILSEDAQCVAVDSIIDNAEGLAVTADMTHLELESCTIWGQVQAKSIFASNCIFEDLLDISRRQTGCIRYSYLPLGSLSPRRFRCQPELEIQIQVKELEKTQTVTPADRLVIEARVLSWLFPVFNASNYGHHAYAQLGNATPPQIITGADNASEMGVFNHLQQPQRETNIKVALQEYLRLGLEAGILYVT